MRGNKRPKQRGVISENIEDETNQKGNFGEGLQYFSFSFSSSLTPPPPFSPHPIHSLQSYCESKLICIDKDRADVECLIDPEGNLPHT